MGALKFHEHDYPTEFPVGEKRSLEVVTLFGKIEIRIGVAGDEVFNNGRYGVILTTSELKALIEDLERAAGRYAF